jgi:hypothetical protein
MPSTTIKYFTFEHLVGDLRDVSRKVAELAQEMEKTLPDNPEKSAGMRKLLEAKDAFVRSALEIGKPQ